MKQGSMSATSASKRAQTDMHGREVVAWLVVVLTLAVAVFGALEGGTAGLVLGISTLSGGASDVLESFGDAIPLGYAFAFGMASAVNPCGFALLPTYLGLYLGSAALERRPWPAQLARASVVSVTMTASFVVLFGAAGVVLG